VFRVRVFRVRVFRVPALAGGSVRQGPTKVGTLNTVHYMYDYRKMTPAQRREIVELRRNQGRPWHSPPHWEFEGNRQFIISAACFEHVPVIGRVPTRMTECETSLVDLCEKYASVLYAWCVLPNHYHILIRTDRIKSVAS